VNPEGSIRVRLAWDGKRVCDALIEPRPLVPLNKLLRGKQPKDALQMIPMLFSLCGQAQAAAAAAALLAASLQEPPQMPLWRERRVLTETVQELLWRLLLDLPRIMRAPADVERLAALRRRLADCWEQNERQTWLQEIDELEDAVSIALLGCSSACLHSIDEAGDAVQLLAMANTATARLLTQCVNDATPVPAKAIPCMPYMDRNKVFAGLLPSLRDDPGFPSRPHWQGQPLETGSLARMRDAVPIAGLLAQSGPSPSARLIARLLEIFTLFNRLRAPDLPEDSVVQGAPCGTGSGVAWVQNARGLLLHRAVLDSDGAIADYCVVTPTEWNFHPEGACVQGLRNISASTEAEAIHAAELLIHSLDPCVAYQIEVDHA
jgi:hypothetical protein